MKSIDIDYFEYNDQLTLETRENGTYVFDIIRKKYVKLLPEELVRQLCVHYLIKEKNVSKNHIKVEKTLKYASLVRRYDILVVDKNGEPVLLVECKAPKIKLDQGVLDQISHYNIKLKVPFLFVTNGKLNYCYQLNEDKTGYTQIDFVPNRIVANIG